MRCRDVFGAAGVIDAFWGEIHSKLTYLHGSPGLSPAKSMGRATLAQDCLTFLASCSDQHFLDFVEFVFQVPSAFHVSERESLVDDFSEFLNVDDLPYSVTPFIWTTGVSTQYGLAHDTLTLTGHPQVIRKDSGVVHSMAIEPALALLREKRFASANTEFLAALKDFRAGDYGDCLAKCGSTFESVLKVICASRGWPYQPTDTASPLLKTVIARSGMESFLEQPLIVIASLRNKLSTAHGAGGTPRQVSKAKAEYAVNATASAILLMVAECR